jgi:glucosyl-3-phosphoglycerate synthase
MEYVQERVTTLHDFGDATPSGPTDRTAVVVPMTERDHASLAAERVFGALERVDPERVVVPLRANASAIPDVRSWMEGFSLDVELLWCTAPRVESLLGEAGLDGGAGKGRDVWLALGVAATSEYVVVHDADAKTYTEAHVPKLLFPVANGHDFAKGYYARVENDRLYGRLFRLFYAPLVRALAETEPHPIVDYFDAFRYGLAGEFAVTGEMARQLRAQRSWGLEVGTLGEAYRLAGFDRSAQVDLGVHEHDHRSVGGPQGLGDMCREVGGALFQALADAGVSPAYDDLIEQYREEATSLVDQYAADAAFNGLTHDATAEREQVDTYAGAIEAPGPDERLPAWEDAPLSPDDVLSASRTALDEAVE